MVEMKGIYNRTSADNYEEFLTALGVSWHLRIMATNSAPKMEGEIVLNEFRALNSIWGSSKSYNFLLVTVVASSLACFLLIVAAICRFPPHDSGHT